MKKAIFFILYFLSPLLPIAAIYLSNTGYYGGSGLIPMVLGACAFTWLNAQMIISARPRLIESTFGLDRIFRFHSLMPVIAIASAFVHKLIKGESFEESLKTQLGDTAIIIFIVVSGLALVFMIDTVVRWIKPLGIVRKYAVKLFVGKYNIQKLLHNAVAAAVILVFLHVMLSSSAKNTFVKTVYIAYFSVSMGFYLYHKVVMRYFLSKKYIVENVTEEAGSMSTIVLKPESGKVDGYLPGQFGFIRILGDDISGEEHPFSLTSEPTNTDTISMTIKNLGDWTADVQRIRPGSRARLTGPYGRFSPLLYPTDKTTVLIAGGVGITPMLSMLRYFNKKEKDRKVILFWGINSRSEQIFPDEFEAFRRGMKNFTLVPVIAKEADYEGEKGYMTQDMLERVMKDNDADLQDAQYFICGPAVMQINLVKGLKSKGIRKSRIHSESFSL